jgi:hypothetical protein
MPPAPAAPPSRPVVPPPPVRAPAVPPPPDPLLPALLPEPAAPPVPGGPPDELPPLPPPVPELPAWLPPGPDTPPDPLPPVPPDDDAPPEPVTWLGRAGVQLANAKKIPAAPRAAMLHRNGWGEGRSNVKGNLAAWLNRKHQGVLSLAGAFGTSQPGKASSCLEGMAAPTQGPPRPFPIHRDFLNMVLSLHRRRRPRLSSWPRRPSRSHCES